MNGMLESHIGGAAKPGWAAGGRQNLGRNECYLSWDAEVGRHLAQRRELEEMG